MTNLPDGLTARRLELRHLRYFVMLATERNFSRAAVQLGIAQPGLSQQILNLEALVGTPLIDRRRRSLALTVAGQVFLKEAEKTLAQAETTLLAARRVGRGETGRISIGYVASAAYAGALTSALGRFRGAHPGVSLHIIEMEMTRQLDSVAGGSLDFGYIRPPAAIPNGVVVTTVLREPLVVALPRGHHLAGEGRVPLQALASETFITPRQDAEVGFHQIALRACREAGFTPSINAEGRDFTAIMSMVAVGLGVALVPQSLDCMGLPGLVYRPIETTSVTSDLAAAYRHDESSPAVRAFIELNTDLGSVA